MCRHIIDKDSNSISMYPFPSYQTQKDLYVIDSSSVDINDEYNYVFIVFPCNVDGDFKSFFNGLQYNRFNYSISTQYRSI